MDYDSTAALSDLQLDGRCGSRLLKRETSSFGIVDDINKKASRKLRSVLQEGDLGAIMLILLSQIRQKNLYAKSDSKEHIKVLGNMYDDCESMLCLLLEYLSDSSEDQPSGPNAKERYANSMPPLVQLHEDYGVDTAVAWMLCRPLVRKSKFFLDDKKLSGSKSSEEPPAFFRPFASSSEMMSSYQKLLPEAAWKHISLALFEAFYSFSVYDIVCPEERYNSEIGRLKKEVESLTQLQKGGDAARGAMASMAASMAAAGGTDEQIRRSTAFTKEHAMKLDRLKHNKDQLSKDFSRQQKRCQLVHSQLKSQKDALIVAEESGESSCGEFAPAFMTFCVYPRCFLSPEDGLFCFHFIKMLHKMKVPGFLTIELIDNIINAATGSFYCVTEDEAGNLAIFLNEIWKVVNTWRYDNDAFASELKDTVSLMNCHSFCCFFYIASVLNPLASPFQPGSRLSKTFAEENNIGEHSITDGVTHDDYKTLYTKWHLRIGSASIGCLKSSEYMYTRAALIVLSRIVLVYPTQPKVGDKILDTLTSLQGEDNPRPDIRATAQGYSSQLMKARDEGMWKEENLAVTRARQEREKLKAEERKKELAQRHEDMKKETEKIDKEIGNSQWGRGGRDDGRGRPWGNEPRMNPRPPPPPPPPLNPGAPKFIPRDGGETRQLNNFESRRGDGHDHVRQSDSRRSGPDGDAWERDRGGIRPASGRHNDSRGGDSRRGDDSGGGGRRKRSRSPEGDDGDRDNPSQKRFRGPQSSRNARSSSPSRGGDRRRGGSSRY